MIASLILLIEKSTTVPSLLVTWYITKPPYCGLTLVVSFAVRSLWTRRFAVSGAAVKGYLWQYKSAVGSKWYNLNSATQGYNKDTLKVKATAGRKGYSYRCVVTLADGTKLTSDAATLTVVTYPVIRKELRKELKVDEKLTVSVDAENGAFPEGTVVEAKKVAIDDVQKAVDEAEDVDGKVLYAVDITFTKDGQELQPAAGKAVKVSFRAAELKDKAEDAAVVHIDSETRKAEPVETVETDKDDEVSPAAAAIWPA